MVSKWCEFPLEVGVKAAIPSNTACSGLSVCFLHAAHWAALQIYLFQLRWKADLLHWTHNEPTKNSPEKLTGCLLSLFAVLGKAVTSVPSPLYSDSSTDIAMADCFLMSSLKLNKSELSLKVASFFEKCYLNVTAIVNKLWGFHLWSLCHGALTPTCSTCSLYFFFLIAFNYFSSLLIWGADWPLWLLAGFLGPR